MQLIDIFITKHQIETYFKDPARQIVPFPLVDSDGRPIPVLTGLAEFLRQFDSTESHRIKFILDQNLGGYRYIKLPLTNKSKVINILEF